VTQTPQPLSQRRWKRILAETSTKADGRSVWAPLVVRRLLELENGSKIVFYLDDDGDVCIGREAEGLPLGETHVYSGGWMSLVQPARRMLGVKTGDRVAWLVKRVGGSYRVCLEKKELRLFVA